MIQSYIFLPYHKKQTIISLASFWSKYITITIVTEKRIHRFFFFCSSFFTSCSYSQISFASSISIILVSIFSEKAQPFSPSKKSRVNLSIVNTAHYLAPEKLLFLSFINKYP